MLIRMRCIGQVIVDGDLSLGEQRSIRQSCSPSPSRSFAECGGVEGSCSLPSVASCCVFVTVLEQASACIAWCSSSDASRAALS